MQIARDALSLGHEVQLLDFATSARERERCRGLHPECLQQVDLVRLQRLAAARHHHADDRERLVGGVQRYEHARIPFRP